jgi:hypothetical protein
MKAAAADELKRVVCAGGAVEALTSRPWASVTFSGERHEFVLRLPLAAASAFLDGLEAREFALRDHILADIALVAAERDDVGARLTLEALTVEAD